MKRIFLRSLVGFSLTIALASFWTSSVLAAKYIAESSVINVDISEKAEMTATYLCFKNNGTNGTITPELWASSGSKNLGNSHTAYIWNDAAYSLKSVACQSLFTNSQFTPASKVPVTTIGQEALATFFTNIGYTKTVSEIEGGYCAVFHFESMTVEGATATAKICAPNAYYNDEGVLVIGDGRLETDVKIDDPSGKATVKPISFVFSTGSNSITGLALKLFCNLDSITNSFGLGDSGTFKYGDGTRPSSVGLEDYANDIFNAILKYYESKGNISGTWKISGTKPAVEPRSGGNTTYTLNDSQRSTAGLKAVRFFFGNQQVTSESKLALSTVQQKNLLTDILNNYYKIAYFGGSEATACGDLDETEQSNASAHDYKPVKVNKSTTCYIRATENEKGSLRLFNPDSGILDGTLYSFDGVLKAITDMIDAAPSNVDLNVSLEATDIGQPTLPDDDSDTAGEHDLANCYSGGGALGWIMCPVLSVVGGITETAYNLWIEPALEIQSGTIFDRNKGVYAGWSAFRNFANIIFAILFLVIIFSQVTGFGLDNYGIKKVLPRLIMVAVLVNISYILCQLAVDVSNLLGVGLKDLFNNNLPVRLNGDGGLFDGDATSVAGGIFGSVIAYLGLGAAGVKLAAITLPVLGQGAAWLIAMLLIAFIGCLVSVLFFLITLAVRQAGVIMLVVLSPVAIVCYALPNTKGFFDKWKKLFQALLVVYPICGILMGGGNYAGSILLGIGSGSAIGALGTFYTITAMLVTVVPFFFIPAILKSSLLAMGNLGMKISNAGKRLGHGVGGLVRGSQGYQELLKNRKIALNQARINALDKKPKLTRGQSLRRNRYATENRRLLEEYAAAKANEKRPPMKYGNDEFNNEVENTISNNINRSAAAKEAAWNSSGLIDDFDALEGLAYKAYSDLNEDFSNEDARATLLAASNVLEASEPGHQRLINALLHANHDVAGDAGQEAAARRTGRWLANAGLKRNGSKLKEETPILNAMYKRLQNGELLQAKDIEAVTDSRGHIVGYNSEKDIASGFSKIVPGLMPGMDENELNKAYKIIERSQRSDAPPELKELGTQLAGAAAQVFSNDQIAKGVKPKEGSIIQRMANYNLATNGLTSKERVAKVSEADLARIETGLNNGMIKDADRETLLDRLELGVAAAVGDGDFNGMSSNKAQIINRILEAHRGDFISRRSINHDRYKDLLQRDFHIDRS